MQIWLEEPSAENQIVLPDASGIMVVEAAPPLYVDTVGTAYLIQDEILSVGALTAGSIARGFGRLQLCHACLHVEHGGRSASSSKCSSGACHAHAQGFCLCC